MTTLEIVLISIIWMFIGLFISYKREWYQLEQEPGVSVVCNMLFAPISLIISFIRVYCVNEW